MKKILPIYLLILAICLAALPAIFCGQSVALAAGASSAAQQGLEETAGAANLTSGKDAVTLAGTIVQTVLSFLGIIFIILLLYGGFIRMTAQGSPDKIKHSTGIITSAIVGIIIIFTSYIVTIFVLNQASQVAGGSENSSPNTNSLPSSGIHGGGVNPGSLPSLIECVDDTYCSCPSYGTPKCVNGECQCIPGPGV